MRRPFKFIFSGRIQWAVRDKIDLFAIGAEKRVPVTPTARKSSYLQFSPLARYSSRIADLHRDRALSKINGIGVRCKGRRDFFKGARYNTRCEYHRSVTGIDDTARF